MINNPEFLNPSPDDYDFTVEQASLSNELSKIDPDIVRLEQELAEIPDDELLDALFDAGLSEGFLLEMIREIDPGFTEDDLRA